jgi:hypothetical protein
MAEWARPDLESNRLLQAAVRAERWELAALCLVATALDVISRLPPEAADELIEMLTQGQRPQRSTRRRKSPHAGS